MARAHTIMIQGTSSGVGKSVLAAALCRIFRRDGWAVAPFKAQNMALNSAVTPDGGEIGRSQAVQAAAAGVPPTVDMNPILIKPTAGHRAQVIVRGRPLEESAAADPATARERLETIVLPALDSLRRRCDIVVIEGAGSPAEVNLWDRDIVNMRVARACGAPVLLCGDVDRGGVLASLVGTLELLPAAERRLVRGLVVNKFRGDRDSFAPAVRFLTERTGLPVLGVVPWCEDIMLPEEDSVALDSGTPQERPAPDDPSSPDSAGVEVVVVHLPHLSNFTDFDLLARHPEVHLRYVRHVRDIGSPDLVILPGTKNTIDDLAALYRHGLAAEVTALAAAGTPIVGICGGYQMLGQRIDDPDGREGSLSSIRGLGLLDCRTTFRGSKITAQVLARLEGRPTLLEGLAPDVSVPGYEIHMGRTTLGPRARPLLRLRRGPEEEVLDGAVDESALIWGSTVHDFLACPEVIAALVAALQQHRWGGKSSGSVALAGPTPGCATLDDRLDHVARLVRNALDMKALYALILEHAATSPHS